MSLKCLDEIGKLSVLIFQMFGFGFGLGCII